MRGLGKLKLLLLKPQGKCVWGSSSTSAQSRKEPQSLGRVEEAGRQQGQVPECQQYEPSAGLAPP